jgi:N-carbamoyl-D-amino-acid hydrolase
VSRVITVAAAQLGPVPRGAKRAAVVARMLALMAQAARERATLVVFPELALTSFFPRWYIDNQQELDGFYEAAMPGPDTQPLFAAARELRLGLSFGYGELALQSGRRQGFNSAVLVGQDGALVGHYRKVHLPGDRDPQPGFQFQHLEKRYFETGDLGFPVWRAFGGVVGMAICNDRRWPEAWRVMGLQGVELVLVGYNTPLQNPEAPEHDPLVRFHHRLVMQAGAYQNATWAVAVAKGGVEEGQAMLADTVIVAPSGEIVASSSTEGDELVLAECDLERTRSYKSTIFDFAAHREPAAYRLITERKGAEPPP